MKWLSTGAEAAPEKLIPFCSRCPRNIFRLGVIRTGFQKFSRCCFMVDSDFLMMMRDLGSGTEDQGFSRSSISEKIPLREMKESIEILSWKGKREGKGDFISISSRAD